MAFCGFITTCSPQWHFGESSSRRAEATALSSSVVGGGLGGNPASKHLTFGMINVGVEKQNSWVKLVWPVDPLEEKAPEVGLQNSFNSLIVNKT